MMKSSISNKEIQPFELVRATDVRTEIFTFIRTFHHNFTKDSFLTLEELNYFRRQYIASLLIEEKGQLASIDNSVMDAIKNNSILSENIEDNFDSSLSFGQKIADKIAEFGGSWTFIISFFSFLLLWIGVNSWFLLTKPFDPFPFILLNLILSCLAAIQAPIIMMSQNRQEQKDRSRSEHDYKINLKAELEIKLLSEKIDHLLVHHNQKLLEIQQIQTDYLEDLMREIKNK